MKRLILSAVMVTMLAAACSSDGACRTTPTTVSTTTSSSTTVTTAEPEPAEEPLPDLGPAKELVGIDGWLQSDVESLEDLRGSVVVVQFWTFGCHNCKATLPNLEAFYAEHQGADFEIVGVHSPEFDYEKDPAAISEAAVELGVTWPIAMDTNGRASTSGKDPLRTGPAPTCSTRTGASASTTSVKARTRN